ncbi:extracellular solute-binding protein [Alicyclobacillus dauci]|uniref:Extracellular solute-binding protein n=1 Tax=Alicyclobacillus dauci TaxID=1475485 RepID=A0ABY6Z5N3_9BACL|nr:extracellular solute-binding protein [Alicyclobacillus dauci]WAH37963.1 extracellular solute-binding protein [Alicyclobacillus dauci]
MKSKRLTLAASAVLGTTLLVAGCGNTSGNASSGSNTTSSKVDASQQIAAPFQGAVAGLPQITAPKGFNWKQYSGTTLNMITENTPPSSALAENIKEFEDVTGITVNIEQADLSTVAQKVALDFQAKSDKYQLIYADPYQMLAKYSYDYLDLNQFINDKSLPPVPGGLSDFIQSQLMVDGYMGTKDHLYALPYDTPTMVLVYRKDIFDNPKYKSLFQKENGFDWTPGPNLTWEKYLTIEKWINKEVKAGVITGVQYGAGEQAKEYDSLQCDFSDVLAAYGGDYFSAPNLGSIGTTTPGKSLMDSKQAIAAATIYKQIVDNAAPGSTSWDWNGLGEAFAAGDVAMAPEWHEFASTFENPSKSKVAGNVGYAILPKGPVRSANIFGGTGLAISKYATPEQQKAAWLFEVWATSPQAQYMILKSKDGGETPTRTSVYNLPEIQKGMTPGTPESKAMPNLLSMNATLQAWKAQNVYMRPKIPQWPQVDNIVFTQLSDMLANKQTPAQAMQNIATQSNQVTGN